MNDKILSAPPLRGGKSYYGEFKQKYPLKTFRATHDVPKKGLIFDSLNNLEEMITEAFSEAENSLIDQFRDFCNNAPDEIIKAFIETYIYLEFSEEYDIRTQSYEFIVTPHWKDASDVDTNSKSFKLLEMYYTSY